MEINKLLGILRNPYGIASDVVKEARLEAANIVEKNYTAESCCPTAVKQPKKVLNICGEDVNKVHLQKGLDKFDYGDMTKKARDKFKGAPKNHIEEGKHDMSELPLDLLAELLCPAYQEGTHFKYYRNSWRKGFKMSVMFAACLRHLTKFFCMRETYDQETLKKYGIKKHHLGAAIFCIVALYNDWKNHPKNDDRIKEG